MTESLAKANHSVAYLGTGEVTCTHDFDEMSAAIYVREPNERTDV